jgi:argininosuccinate lyase
MMPQKKNPDALELIRGKSGRVFGNLSAMLSVLKGLPLSYNRDLQEDKELLFDTIETIKSCLKLINKLIPQIIINKERMENMGQNKMLLATDVADYLAKNGIPFRDAHEIVGNILKEYDNNNDNLLDNIVKKYVNKINKKLVKGIENILTAHFSIDQRDVIGGTARRQVMKQINRIENILDTKV